MTIKEVEIIYDINSTGFLVASSLYVNVIEDENHSMNFINKSIVSLSFESTVSKIIADSSVANKIKTEDNYGEIFKTFDVRKGRENEEWFNIIF